MKIVNKEKNHNIDKNRESGLKHWWHQKLSAIVMIPLSIWLLLNLPNFFYLSYEQKILWLNNITNFLFLMIFLFIASYHMKLGLTVVIEDYIHNIRIKFFLLKTLKIFTFTAFLLILVLIVVFLKEYLRK